MLSKCKEKLRAFHDDQDGSEAVEMVYTTAMLVMFIMIGIMLLSYVLMLTNVNHVTKLVCRDIEVTGQFNQTTLVTKFKSMLPSDQLINHDVQISVVSGNHGPGKIQLKGIFEITGYCEYIIQLINPGNFTGYRITLPVSTTVSGMSEVYWGS